MEMDGELNGVVDGEMDGEMKREITSDMRKQKGKECQQEMYRNMDCKMRRERDGLEQEERWEYNNGNSERGIMELGQQEQLGTDPDPPSISTPLPHF